MNEVSAAKPDNHLEPSPSTDRTIAAIDIGANAVRMVIAQVTPDGTIEILERFQQAVRLGQDVFRQGRLGARSMRAAVAVIHEYAQRLRSLDVRRVRAVATSVGREASNTDTLIDRIFMATGLNVEVIDTSEESRLIVSAVCGTLDEVPDASHADALIADVGGGSTLLTVLHDGQMVASQSLRLGAVRLQEVFDTGDESPKRRAEVYRQQITKETLAPQRDLTLEKIDVFIAVGGDARFAADQVGRPSPSGNISVIRRKPFEELLERCSKMTAEKISARFGIPFAEAETVNPALQVYHILWQRTRSKTMIVSRVSMRDGLLIELARDVTGQEDSALQKGIVLSAQSLAQKYQVDLPHAETVANLSVQLFDVLQSDHGLSARYRILLRVAAILHEIGGFVSNRAHHKHSYYLIANSEIFGLSRDERRIVAHVARYHRRSSPKPTHEEYMILPRQTRIIINKLAAILRVADALSRGQAFQTEELKIERVGDDLIVYVPGGADLYLEQHAIADKGRLFEEIYGMRIRVEQI